MDELKAWLGDVFYKDVTISEAHNGYVTEYYRNSYSDRYETIQLPFSMFNQSNGQAEDKSHRKNVING